MTGRGADPDDSGPGAELHGLDLSAVLELVAARCATEAGAHTVRALTPILDRQAAVRELRGVEEFRAVWSSRDTAFPGRLPDLAGAIRRLALDRSILEPEELVACRDVMAAARALKWLSGVAESGGAVREAADGLWHDKDLEQRITRVFDSRGGIADSASRRLAGIRRRKARQRTALVELLDEWAMRLPDKARVDDASVTVRQGRFCVPVRRDFKGAAKGMVHDASASGRTLFVEPEGAVRPMNDLRGLEIAEAAEVRRILSELTEQLRAAREALGASRAAIVRLDSFLGRARLADDLDGSAPAFAAEDEPARYRHARHPLLPPREAVPFDLDLLPGERMVLISGPNAGGKTVLLKSLGLFSVLAQCGVIPSLGAGSAIFFFRRFFTITGDEQSIEESLSTFSARLVRLATALKEAGPGDLVLIDEIGGATDPTEGGALAVAALERLADRGALTVATTHLGELKRLGQDSARAVTLSMDLDPETLSPTYRVVRGRPGRSYALELASRSGIPPEVVADARGRLSPEHRSLDHLIARLGAEERAAAEAKEELSRARDEALEMRSELERRERELEVLEQHTRRERRKARSEALRDARGLVEKAIDELNASRGRALAEQPPGDGNTGGHRDAARGARSRIEAAIRDAHGGDGAVRRATGKGKRAPRREPPPPRPGDKVRWEGRGTSGLLVAIDGDRGVVEMNGLQLSAPLGQLSAAPRDAEETGNVQAGPVSVPLLEVKTEIDIRGLRLADVDSALEPVVDAAAARQSPFLRIIHGKGGGVLRKRVRAILEGDSRIESFRDGAVAEGGTGVTMVTFR